MVGGGELGAERHRRRRASCARGEWCDEAGYREVPREALGGEPHASETQGDQSLCLTRTTTPSPIRAAMKLSWRRCARTSSTRSPTGTRTTKRRRRTWIASFAFRRPSL